MRLQGYLLILIAALLFFQPVSAAMTNTFGSADTVIVNRTDVISESKSTPISVWILSIIATVILVLISFLKFPKGEEGLVAVMAIFPAVFSYIAAFNVDQITVAGVTAASGTYHILEKHTIYHFDDIAHFILLPLLVWTIVNVIRIHLNYKRINEAARYEDKADQPM